MAAVDTPILFEEITNNQRTINRLEHESQSQYRKIKSLLTHSTEISNNSSIQTSNIPPSNPNENEFIIGLQQQTINILNKYISQQNVIYDKIQNLISKPQESYDIFDADWYKALLIQYSYFVTRDQIQNQKIQNLQQMVKFAAIKHEDDKGRIKSLESECASYRAIIKELPDAVIEETNGEYIEIEEGKSLSPPPWNHPE